MVFLGRSGERRGVESFVHLLASSDRYDLYGHGDALVRGVVAAEFP